MSVDAGSVYSSVRIRLGDLDNDLKGVYARMGSLEKNITTNTTKSASSFKSMFGAVVTGQAVLGLAQKGFQLLTGAISNSMKVAVESQEIISKYGVVFEGMGTASEDAAKTFADSFDLAGATAKEMLSNTGNLLQGMGATKEESLQLSLQVNTLAGDLASFTNNAGGSKSASEALTKALLGERESMKTLGIAILESDVVMRVARNGQENLTGTALKMARAQATVQLITEQAKNSIGDYARTSDSAANSQKRAAEATKELQIAVGSGLNPVLKFTSNAWTTIAGSLTKVFERKQGAGELTVATQELEIATNNYKVAVRELEEGSSTLSETEKGLIENRKALAGLDIQASLNSLSQGYEKTNQKIIKLDNEKIESARLVSINLNRISELEIAIAQKSEKQKKKDKGTIDDLDAALVSARSSATIFNQKQIEADKQVTTLKSEQKSAILAIAQAYKKGDIDISSYKKTNYDLYDAIIRAAKGIKETVKPVETLNTATKDAIVVNKEEAATVEEVIVSQEDLLQSRLDLADATRATEKERRQSMDDIIAEVNNLGAVEKTEGESAKTALIDKIKIMGFIPEQQKEIIELVEKYYKALEEKEATKKFLDNTSEALGAGIELYSAYANLINQLNKNQVDEQTRMLDAETDALSEALDERQRLETKAAKDVQETRSNAMKEAHDYALELLDAELQAELYKAGLTKAATIEQLQAELDAAIEAGDETNIEEARDALEKANIEKDFADQKTALEKQQAAEKKALEVRQAAESLALQKSQKAEEAALEEQQARKLATIQYKAAMVAWKMQLALSIASAAQAVIGALAAFPFFPANAGFVAATAGTGILQVAAVNAAKPVLAYAKGGIVEARDSGTLVNVAENGSPEVLFNTGASGQAFVNQMAGAIASQLTLQNSGMSATIIIQLDPNVIAESTIKLVNNGKYLIKARSIL